MESREAASYWEGNAENWTRYSRAGYDVYRDALNTPAFLAMLPPIAGLQGLDIGCGEGSNTRKLAELGASMRAIDVAPTFIRHAQEKEAADPRGVIYEIADGAALPFADESFDFATAFMSLMDMPDQQRVLIETRRVLKPGGFLQFSILHPCFVPPHRKTLRDEKGDCYAIEIAEYFSENDGRIETWWFSTLPREEREGVAPFRVPRFHRTLSAWVDMICGAGLTIQKFGEPSASPEVAAAVPTVADTRVAGLFLHVRAIKLAA
ncbi:class I SAM-dependent methyltransferase [Terrarubrum flagellatum]|uniref:class I SAM-dependent methyltransferase n=1 Tax=Terrirubrum flagellatum TaxID=2895980 RepID=UPI00314526E0